MKCCDGTEVQGYQSGADPGFYERGGGHNTLLVCVPPPAARLAQVQKN